MMVPVLTMVSEEQAKEGGTFVFMGEQIECTDCRYRNICLNLEKGAAYRILGIRPPVHECGLTGGNARVVQVERITRGAVVDKKYAIDGSLITFFPSECGQIGCEYYRFCNPDGIAKEEKVKIANVCKKAPCPIGQNRVLVNLE